MANISTFHGEISICECGLYEHPEKQGDRACRFCWGRGFVAACTACDGKGRIEQKMAGGPGTMSATCSMCGGVGCYGVNKGGLGRDASSANSRPARERSCDSIRAGVCNFNPGARIQDGWRPADGSRIPLGTTSRLRHPRQSHYRRRGSYRHHPIHNLSLSRRIAHHREAGQPSQEVVTILTVPSATTFTANFVNSHIATAPAWGPTFPTQQGTDPIFTQSEMLQYLRARRTSFLRPYPASTSASSSP